MVLMDGLPQIRHTCFLVWPTAPPFSQPCHSSFSGCRRLEESRQAAAIILRAVHQFSFYRLIAHSDQPIIALPGPQFRQENTPPGVPNCCCAITARAKRVQAILTEPLGVHFDNPAHSRMA